jgi:predicted TIM-barrel fold metal-dependent hydrolase
MELAGPLVDCHAHVWGPDMPFSPAAWTRPAYTYTAEDWLADLGRHGIEHGVIAAASLFGTYNDYTLAALARHPNLRGTAILDWDADDALLADLRASGIVGVRLQWLTLAALPDFAGAEFQGFCHRLRDHGLHIHLNIAGDRLGEVAAAITGAGVRLVLDHYGWHDFDLGLAAPSYLEMVRLLEGGQVWVKLSSGFRRPDPELPRQYTRDLIARVGPERLLWGSDAPFVGHEGEVSYRDVIEEFHRAVPDAAMRDALGQSAYSFYFAG